MNSLLVLWVGMAWCLSTRASVATVLIMHTFPAVKVLSVISLPLRQACKLPLWLFGSVVFSPSLSLGVPSRLIQNRLYDTQHFIPFPIIWRCVLFAILHKWRIIPNFRYFNQQLIVTNNNAHYLWWLTLEPLIWLQCWVQISLQNNGILSK